MKLHNVGSDDTMIPLYPFSHIGIIKDTNLRRPLKSPHHCPSNYKTLPYPQKYLKPTIASN